MAEPSASAGIAERLAALREQGAGQIDPIRFRFIEALAQRAATQQGQARQRLDARLEQALLAYAAQRAATPVTDTPIAKGTDSPLAALLAHIAQAADLHDSEGGAGNTGADAIAHCSGPAPLPADELKAIRYFRDTWSRLDVEKQLAQALAETPENAGPLNSHLLVLRSLQRMNELSPDYLHRFMSYVETLLWLEQDNLRAIPGDSAASPAKSAKKSR